MMTKQKILSTFKPVLLAAAVAALAGCNAGSSSGGSGSGSLSLNITDAPVDSALAVVVTFTGVELQPEEGERISISFDAPKQIDLLALNGGVSTQLLDGITVPSGEYSWVRLYVDESMSYIDVGAGQEPLSIPSGAQTGLKLNHGFEVGDDSDESYTIDFDLRKSVTLTATGYKLRPTLRIVEDKASGTLSGIVDSSLIAAACADSNVSAGAVYLFEDELGEADDVDGDDGDPEASAMVELDVDSNYSYKLAYIEAGTYLVAYTCDATSDEADDPSDGDSEDNVLTFYGESVVTITAGGETTLDFSAI